MLCTYKRGDKFARQSRCVFIGYLHGKKGWKLYDLNSQEYFVSRDVVFHEGVFPFADKMENISPISIPVVDNMVDSCR